MIKKLESAGLGYHVSAGETEDKLGMTLLKMSLKNITVIHSLSMDVYSVASWTVVYEG